jgi:hypothetical protein
MVVGVPQVGGYENIFQRLINIVIKTVIIPAIMIIIPD